MIPDKYSLYITNEHYYVVPHDRSEFIHIDRVSQETVIEDDASSLPSSLKAVEIFGILGTINLLSGWYLAVITKRVSVCDLLGHSVFKVTSSELYPYAKSTLHLSDSDLELERTYIEMLKNALQLEGFYYSLTYDLTVSQQRLSDAGPQFDSSSLFSRAESQFVWNHFLLSEWHSQLLKGVEKKAIGAVNFADFCLPVMVGFVDRLKPPMHTSVAAQLPFYILISRRSTNRAGTRFFARGVDDKGHAANTIETEQLVGLPTGHIFSFVQLRGSVPLFWSQRPNLKYKPSVKMGRLQPKIAATVSSRPTSPVLLDLDTVDSEQLDAIRGHFSNPLYLHAYGRQVVINLLDQKGMERTLCQTYANSASILGANIVKYEEFDFHRECRHMQWHRLNLLTNRLVPDLRAMGQLHLVTESTSLRPATIKASQMGTFRTNCIDCLDRTNVVQSMLARCALELALQSAGETSATEDLMATATMEALWPGFETAFKAIWADNADVCSLQYTGTRALKTDFTRTGKRTWKGLLMDGYNSMVRYYQNNFLDGFRQDSINLLLGHFRVFDEDKQPNRQLTSSEAASDKHLRSKFLPVVFAFALSMSVLCLLFPTDHWSEQAMYFLFWGTASVTSALTIFTYGEDFVDKPRFLMQ